MMAEEINQAYKIFLLSCTPAGKTCILNRFIENYYIDNPLATIGIDFNTKIIELDNGKKVILRIWDTNSREGFRGLTRNYYKGAGGIILIYDITDRDSFENLDDCFNDIIYCYSKYIPIFLIGNKIDIEDRREITFAEGKEFSEKHGLMFCECSAKTGENIDFIFNKLANKIHENKIKKEKEKMEKELKKIEEEEKQKKLKKEKKTKNKDKDNTNKIENNTGNEEKECDNLKTLNKYLSF